MARSGTLPGILLTLTAAVAPPAARAHEAPRAQQASYSATLLEADSQSVGQADAGRLEHPFALQNSDTLVSVGPHRYGTRELVGLLDRAAASVARTAPGARLAVGDLSAEHGGYLSPHESHQSGRDADVGFFMLAEDGEPVPRALFLRVDADGSARRGERRYRFDDARNWALLSAFVNDPMAETQYVILAPHIRERLLAHGRAMGASEEQLRRVEVVTARMRGSDGHDDHFHVRVYCSVGDRPACLDRPPLHPWYDGTPSPRAVAAARAADLLRAAALRRQQRRALATEQDLAREERQQELSEEARAQQLSVDLLEQREQERRRAAQLTADERGALRRLRRMEQEGLRLGALAAAAERGRVVKVSAEERRWRAAEKRRAQRLRAALRKLEADDRKRQARDDARARLAARKAEAQRAAERKSAEALLRKGERLQRERARLAARQLQ